MGSVRVLRGPSLTLGVLIKRMPTATSALNSAAALCLLILPLLFAGIARAEITSFAARVEGEVQEYIGSQAGDSDYAFESFPDGSTSNLPMTALAQLPAGITVQPAAIGQAMTKFSDPRLSTQPSPEEFAVTSIAYSKDPSLSHDSHCTATELRDITFTTADVLATEGTDIQIQSRFYVDGVMLIWTDAGQTDLSNVSATVKLTVEQNRPSSGTSTPFAANVMLAGAADGGATAQTNGGIFGNGILHLDLTGLVDGFGSLHVVVIPNIVVPYPYDAKVGNRLRSRRIVEGQSRNKANGRGAAVLLGAPLEELATAISSTTGSDSGYVLASILENMGVLSGGPITPFPNAKTEVVAPASTQSALTTNSIFGGGCAAFGVESLFGLALFCGFVGLKRR